MGKSKSYGESIERLNDILQNIDESNIPIDKLAEQVVEAADLLKNCKNILTETEAKVKTVLSDLQQEFSDHDDAN
jgi:exodeoxyribonuclease VII small subunit